MERRRVFLKPTLSPGEAASDAGAWDPVSFPNLPPSLALPQLILTQSRSLTPDPSPVYLCPSPSSGSPSAPGMS